MPNSRFDYYCSNCQGDVTKIPTGTRIKKDEQMGLHGWSCPSCGKGIKVGRKLKKEKHAD